MSLNEIHLHTTHSTRLYTRTYMHMCVTGLCVNTTENKQSYRLAALPRKIQVGNDVYNRAKTIFRSPYTYVEMATTDAD